MRQIRDITKKLNTAGPYRTVGTAAVWKETFTIETNTNIPDNVVDLIDDNDTISVTSAPATGIGDKDTLGKTVAIRKFHDVNKTLLNIVFH